jgi:3-oxoacyl-[acyl-carrier protein] reductase
MASLTSKVVLVTGGSRGIGAAIARHLAQHGAAVALTYATSGDQAEAVARQIHAEGSRALVIQADNNDPNAAVNAVEQTVRELGRIDILGNNAGIMAGRGDLEHVSAQEVDQALAVNVRAVFLACQAAARHMSKGGRIINIGTCVSERVPGPGMTLFAMSKSALTGLTRGLARDLGPRGITATVIQPGPIDTDANPADGPGADFVRNLTALGHYGTVDDIASAVAYLAGDGGRYITGTAISIDGGFTA